MPDLGLDQVTGVTTSRSGSNMGELGSTGLRKQGGVVYEEFLSHLHGPRGIRIFTEMRENDPVANGTLFAVEMLFRRLHREIRPADDHSDQALELRDFVEECFDDLENQSMEDVIAEITSMFQFGWFLAETVYKPRSDGRVGWRKFAPRAQETLWRWDFTDAGEIEAFQQLDTLGQSQAHVSVIPWEKLLLFRTTSFKNNPEGRSILRGAYRSWYFKKRIEEIEAIGIERDMAGMPIIWAPEEYFDTNAPQEVKQLYTELQNTVRNIRRDEQDGMIFPLAYDQDGNKRFEFELASTGGRRQIDTSGIIERYSRHMAMTVLADFILLGHEQVGSFALSSSKVDLFATAIDAWSDAIAGVFNQYAIPRLLKLNGIEPTPDITPKLSFEPVRVPSLEELGKFIADLERGGVQLQLDDKLSAHLRTRAGLPPEDAETQVDVEPGTVREQEEDEA